MPEIVDIRTAGDPRDVIHRAVQYLSTGKLVVVPTETVYVVCSYSLIPTAVQELQRTIECGPDSTLTLAVKGCDEALDYFPEMSSFGRKLTRRCWPGPVSLGFPTTGEEGLLNSLPSETRMAIIRENEIVLRVPDDDVISQIQRLLPAPLVLSPETLPGSPQLTSYDDFARASNDRRFDLVIDQGPCRYGEPSSFVRIMDNEWKLVRPGVVTETTLARLLGEMFLFVCTGNTCRSPMAEGIFRKNLAEKLQCDEDELIDRGYVVASAGIAAASNAPASPESVEILKGKGIDLRGHGSQPLTQRLLDQADYVYTMTQRHREMILMGRPEAADRVNLLARDGTDISDPLGGGFQEYERCEAEIEDHLRTILSEIEVR